MTSERNEEPDDPPRPPRVDNPPLPSIPDVEGKDADTASVTYSHYRTGLSRHRTDLSEHRTDLSEHRTDLSEHRTRLSDNRTELSMRRTGMSIQRTRMSADRTLMSIIRTSLSLIGFGFTLHQAFQKLVEVGTIHSSNAPRNFGLSLILLGMFLLVGGIVRHVEFERELRGRRGKLINANLIHGDGRFPISTSLVAAIILLLIGLLAVIGIVFDFHAFG